MENELYKTTLEVVFEAQAVLHKVREEVSQMCRENEQAAFNYVVDLREAAANHTKIGTEGVNRIIEDNISRIKGEFYPLVITSQDIFNGQVGNLRTNIDKIIDTLSAAEAENLTETLEQAIQQAEAEVRAMWRYMDHLYTHFTAYSSEMIENKVQNMTDRISSWIIDSQSEFNSSMLDERWRMCRNIGLANIELAKTIKTVVHIMDSIRNAINTVYNSQLTYSNRGDEHFMTLIENLKSLLAKQKTSGDEILETLLRNPFAFMGTAILATVERVYPFVAKFILRSWRDAIENANSAFETRISAQQLIKDEYRSQIVADVEDCLENLGNQVRTKATLLDDEATKSRLLEKAKFDDLAILMRAKYENVTETIHILSTSRISSTAQALEYNVNEIISKKLPFISTMSIRNYLLTDVCTLQINFTNYAVGVIDDALHKDEEVKLDGLLPTNSATKGVDVATQTEELPADEEWSPTNSDGEKRTETFDDYLPKYAAVIPSDTAVEKIPLAKNEVLKVQTADESTAYSHSMEKSKEFIVDGKVGVKDEFPYVPSRKENQNEKEPDGFTEKPVVTFDTKTESAVRIKGENKQAEDSLQWVNVNSEQKETGKNISPNIKNVDPVIGGTNEEETH